jgi:hypothetical protein
MILRRPLRRRTVHAFEKCLRMWQRLSGPRRVTRASDVRGNRERWPQKKKAPHTAIQAAGLYFRRRSSLTED